MLSTQFQVIQILERNNEKKIIHTVLNYESMASGLLQQVELHTPKVLAHNFITKNVYRTIQSKHLAIQTNSRLFSSSLLGFFGSLLYENDFTCQTALKRA